MKWATPLGTDGEDGDDGGAPPMMKVFVRQLSTLKYKNHKADTAIPRHFLPKRFARSSVEAGKIKGEKKKR